MKKAAGFPAAFLFWSHGRSGQAAWNAIATPFMQ